MLTPAITSALDISCIGPLPVRSVRAVRPRDTGRRDGIVLTRRNDNGGRS